MTGEQRVLLRVWLPDRPGALGGVATRLGSLKGDVVGLEIIERDGGRAIDEVVVCLPADVPLELVVREVTSEDGVTVEDLRILDDSPFDPQLDALDTASVLLGADSYHELAQALCTHIGRCVRSEWSVVLDDTGVTGAQGELPSEAWLRAFVAGSPEAAGGDGSALEIDTVWVPLPAANAKLVIGRDTPFRARERQRLSALARIADAWFRQMRQQALMRAAVDHPALNRHVSEAS